jgi:hypothetical protein
MPNPPIFCLYVCVGRESEQTSIGGLEMRESKIREKDIEIYLRDQVKKSGGKAYKFESPGNDGVPDRLVIFPENRIYFVELKAPGGKPRPLQVKQMNTLKNFGCKVYVIDSKEGVDEFIAKARDEINDKI